MLILKMHIENEKSIETPINLKKENVFKMF